MKTIQFHRLVTFAISIGCVLLIACNKTVDVNFSRPKDLSGFCRIDQIIAKQPFTPGLTDTITYSYNVHGDPITAINNHVRTGAPNVFFRYDRKNRLSDLIGRYQTGPINDGEVLESWHTFYRDRFDRIVLDSAISFPSVENGKAVIGEHGTPAIIKYEYDNLNRVSKQTIFLQSHITENNYTYDAAGNLTGSSYDDKINYRRVNEIWMFLDRDYSRNNALTSGYTYNSAGLPTQIVASGPGGNKFMDITFSAIFYLQADIEYSCKSDDQPGK